MLKLICCISLDVIGFECVCVLLEIFKKPIPACLLSFSTMFLLPAQQCPVIRVENNVQVIGDLEEGNYGTVIRFSCKIRNQILEGPSEIYCDENGQWSGTAPICKGTCSCQK